MHASNVESVCWFCRSSHFRFANRQALAATGWGKEGKQNLWQDFLRQRPKPRISWFVNAEVKWSYTYVQLIWLFLELIYLNGISIFLLTSFCFCKFILSIKQLHSNITVACKFFGYISITANDLLDVFQDFFGIICNFKLFVGEQAWTWILFYRAPLLCWGRNCVQVNRRREVIQYIRYHTALGCHRFKMAVGCVMTNSSWTGAGLYDPDKLCQHSVPDQVVVLTQFLV